MVCEDGMVLFARFLPVEYVNSIYHIHLRQLWETGMRGIVTDLDNTLVEWNAPNAPAKLVAWLEHARELGYKVCILSNNHGPRVAAFAAPLGLPAIDSARKPRSFAYGQALAQTGTEARQTLMIGDQLFTDIWGGNRVGMHTVLVRPIPGREHRATRLIRRVERLVLGSRVPEAAGEYFTGG